MKALLLLLLPALLLALIDAYPSPTPTPGCEPAYWFREQITLHPESLPQGVSLSVLEADDASRPAIEIENKTGEILLVLSLHYQEQLAEPTTPDPDYAARLRYAHEVASYLVPPEAARPITLGMTALLDLDPDLQQLNRLDADRPVEGMVLVPAAQQSMLLMVHADQVLHVPFTISYRLNPDYPSAACGGQGTETAVPTGTPTQSPTEERSSDLPRGLPGLALLVLIVATILGANLISKFRSSTSARN